MRERTFWPWPWPSPLPIRATFDKASTPARSAERKSATGAGGRGLPAIALVTLLSEGGNFGDGGCKPLAILKGLQSFSPGLASLGAYPG